MSQQNVVEVEQLPEGDYILVSEHNLRMKALKEAYTERLQQKDKIIQKLTTWGNGLNAKLSALSQQLYLLKNTFPDLANIVKGQERWAPDSLKNAIMIIDFLWAQYKSVWLMYKRIHEKARRPFWHWGALFVFGATLFGIAANPAGAGAFFTANASAIVVLSIIALVGLWMFRRRSEKRASQPV